VTRKNIQAGDEELESLDSAQDSMRAPPNDAAVPGPFPVVALGASAGGLEALRQLFSHLPAEPGMAFVVIQHLDPERPSMLTRLLEESTQLSVVEAADGMRLESNRVHVIPSGSDLTIEDGVLALLPRRRTGHLHLPIDSFFRALAADVGARAIGVILSGSGADGTEGLKVIKSEGGIAIVQDPNSAQFRSMPENAIAADVVDFRSNPEGIAGELARLSRHRHARQRSTPEQGDDSGREMALRTIFSALHQHAGVDFGGYKRTTVLRRIERRMALSGATVLPEYARSLEGDPAEARALAQDMLIHVTSFFRDAEAFAALKAQVFDELARRGRAEDSIRLWVPGCSTGEEAYALVMCLLEAFEPMPTTPSIKMFGTDLSNEAIETARQGIYPESALSDVSPERLARFFERVDGARYRIGRVVRDLCVFVKHDLTRDPPFAKLDLVSCRNVLIYFDAELQRRVVPMLHYCLNPRGHLFLGRSETIAGFRDLFTPVDKEHRIFVKTGDSQRLTYPMSAGYESEAPFVDKHPLEHRHFAREAQRQADHLLLARFAPPGVIVNERLEVVQFRGRTGAFLEPAPGQPQVNVLRMARDGLAPHLHETVERAKAEGATVRRQGVRVTLGSEERGVDIEVIPLNAASDSGESYFLILFEPPDGADGAVRADVRPASTPEAGEGSAADSERMRVELAATRDYLQSLLSEHQVTTDDLAAANGELIAANEELQSTNEELQSAKEELQSTNEELTTVNDQIRHRNLELDQIASDLVNVLSSVEIPVVIVDLELRVRRFTPTARSIGSFIAADVGRPIDDLKLRLRVDDLTSKIGEVIEGLSPKEWEVQREDGHWYRLQIRPYHTSDHRLDGAVLSFVDVDALKRVLADAEGARDYAQSIVDTVTAALVVLDSHLRVVSANEAFYETFRLSAGAAEGKLLTEFGAALWGEPALRRALEEAGQLQKRFSALEVTTELPERGHRVFSLSGRPIPAYEGTCLVLLTIDDVTELRVLEAERAQLLSSEKQARLEAERATRAKDLFLATLSHELRTPLSTILMSAQVLRRVALDEPRVERPSASIERAAAAQAKLIGDLLDVSRIVSGKLMLDLGPVDFAAVVQEAIDLVRPAAEAKGLDLQTSIERLPDMVYGDAARLLQVVNNLLTNAVKFTPNGGRVFVSLERVDRRVELTVTDTGMGIREDVLPQLFTRFVQADSSVTRTHGGLGLGLSIVRHIVDVHGGDVEVESPGEGKGSTFRVSLPLGAAESSVHPPEPRAIARDIRGARVLLVEDDDDTREAFAAMLTEFGVEARVASSASAGLAILNEFRPQAILSDVALPGEDGFSFIKKVRLLGSSRGGDVPAAALTALAGDDDRRRALASGFQIHVPKPVDAARLASVVGALIDWK
jgi:two-component system CheB/CheR fusion protein